MDTQYLYNLLKSNDVEKDSGFTLIELLVVVILIGILSAVSIPSLIGQIGKARDTEAQINLGTMSRSQQGYHFEHRTFADTLDKLASNVSFTGEYYNYFNPDSATDTMVIQRATSVDSNTNQTKDYAFGVYFDTGSYDFILCQARKVGEVVEAPNTPGGSCSNGGIEIK